MIVSTKISIERFDSSLYNYQERNNYIIEIISWDFIVSNNKSTNLQRVKNSNVPVKINRSS